MKPLNIFESLEAFRESFARRLSDKLEGSWVLQHKSEQRRRLGFVLRMATELKSIREGGTIFCGMWAELAIEAVITGNLEDLKSWGIDGLSEAEFERNTGDHDGAVRYASAYAKFREICEDAYVTARPMEKV